MYEQLEQIVRGYNDQYSRDGGQAVIKRYTKHPDGSEDPLILALCTPLMSRADTLVRQVSEVVYIDSSSSLDDYILLYLYYLHLVQLVACLWEL